MKLKEPKAKAHLRRALQACGWGDFHEKVLALFDLLGYPVERFLALDSALNRNSQKAGDRVEALAGPPPNPKGGFRSGSTPSARDVTIDATTGERIKVVEGARTIFLGQVAGDKPDPDDAVEPGQNEDQFGGTALFVVVDLEQASYLRPELARISRTIQRCFSRPAIILFRYGSRLALALVDGPEAGPLKVSLAQDIVLAEPHPADLELLAGLSLKQPARSRGQAKPQTVLRLWQQALDPQKLYKRFLQDVGAWYLAARAATPADPNRLIRFIVGQLFLRFWQEAGTIPEPWAELDLFDLPPDRLNPSPELARIFERYRFTPLEPSPTEQSYALDPELLGRVYEHLLGLEQTGARSTARKRTASFYTPYEIVNYMVGEALLAHFKELHPDQDFEQRLRHLLLSQDEPHLLTEAEAADLIEAIARLKILDPACGSGAFLLGVLQKLADIWLKLDPHCNLGQVKRYLAENCLYGVDIQPAAVQIVRLRLWLAQTPPESPPAVHLAAANILLDDEPLQPLLARPFDIIIGNPPYINTNELKEMAPIYRRRYTTAYGSYDIYILFFERLKALARPGGLIALLTSNKYLIADYGLKARAFILKNFTLHKLLDLADCHRIFAGAQISPCITLVQNQPPLPQAQLELALLKDDDIGRLPAIEFEKRSINKLASGNKQIFELRLAPDNQQLVDKLLAQSLALGQVAEVRTGVMGFAYWSMAEFIHDGPVERGLRIATNGFIEPYLFRWNKRVKLYRRYFYQPYLDIENCPLNEPTKRLFQQPKLMIRGVARQLSAQLDDEGIGLLVAVHASVIRQEAKLDPRYVLGLLNSKLLNWYHRIRYYTGRIPEGSLRYPVSFLETLPIKQLSLPEQQPLISLVDQMLAAKQADPNTDISSLAETLDGLVYGLYGLSEQEIDLIKVI
jgi:methylase of polypeptide subunit release factors